VVICPLGDASESKKRSGGEPADDAFRAQLLNFDTEYIDDFLKNYQIKFEELFKSVILNSCII